MYIYIYRIIYWGNRIHIRFLRERSSFGPQIRRQATAQKLRQPGKSAGNLFGDDGFFSELKSKVKVSSRDLLPILRYITNRSAGPQIESYEESIL